jgi:hypothetical protein
MSALPDFFAIPDLRQRIRRGELAPHLPDGGTQGLSGRRYPQPRPRGLAPWNPKGPTLEILTQVDAVLVEYANYLPLTVRQIFYRLVGKFDYPKDELAYKRLQEYLNRARRSGRIPWSSIRDDSMVRHAARGFDSPESFWLAVEHTAENYSLHRATGQPRHVEAWCEAAGMVPQLGRVSNQYGVDACSASGFDGVDLKHNTALAAIERFEDDNRPDAGLAYRRS